MFAARAVLRAKLQKFATLTGGKRASERGKKLRKIFLLAFHFFSAENFFLSFFYCCFSCCRRRRRW